MLNFYLQIRLDFLRWVTGLKCPCIFKVMQEVVRLRKVFEIIFQFVKNVIFILYIIIDDNVRIFENNSPEIRSSFSCGWDLRYYIRIILIEKFSDSCIKLRLVAVQYFD